jgi:MFS-type transporter involved in bile tolerance (Atg22 family)
MLPWSIRPSRIQLSLTYCSSFILFGLIGAGIGPLIPIKAAEMNIKETDFGIAFMLKGAGGLLGSFVAPLLESYMKLNKILSLSCILLGICSAVISDTNSMLIFSSMFFLLGMSIMFINILSTVAIIRIMPKRNTEAWIKALHFSFGIGAFVTTLYVISRTRILQGISSSRTRQYATVDFLRSSRK